MQPITKQQIGTNLNIAAYRADQPPKRPVSKEVEDWVANGGKIEKVAQGVSGNKWTGYK